MISFQSVDIAGSGLILSSVVTRTKANVSETGFNVVCQAAIKAVVYLVAIVVRISSGCVADLLRKWFSIVFPLTYPLLT